MQQPWICSMKPSFFLPGSFPWWMCSCVNRTACFCISPTLALWKNPCLLPHWRKNRAEKLSRSSFYRPRLSWSSRNMNRLWSWNCFVVVAPSLIESTKSCSDRFSSTWMTPAWAKHQYARTFLLLQLHSHASKNGFSDSWCTQKFPGLLRWNSHNRILNKYSNEDAEPTSQATTHDQTCPLLETTTATDKQRINRSFLARKGLHSCLNQQGNGIANTPMSSKSARMHHNEDTHRQKNRQNKRKNRS